MEVGGKKLIIVGEKIILRAVERSDKDILRNLINDSDTEYLLGGWSFPISDFIQEEWMKSLKPNPHILRCMIEEKKDKKTLGTVILSDIDYKNGTAEVHIKLMGDYRGMGYGTDTLKAVVVYSFHELRLQCIYACVNEYNIASQKSIEKIGFQMEGKLRKRIYKRGTYHDLMVYSVLREEWNGNRE